MLRLLFDIFKIFLFYFLGKYLKELLWLAGGIVCLLFFWLLWWLDKEWWFYIIIIFIIWLPIETFLKLRRKRQLRDSFLALLQLCKQRSLGCEMHYKRSWRCFGKTRKQLAPSSGYWLARHPSSWVKRFSVGWQFPFSGQWSYSSGFSTIQVR